jgi:hypothetical protein
MLRLSTLVVRGFKASRPPYSTPVALPLHEPLGQISRGLTRGDGTSGSDSASTPVGLVVLMVTHRAGYRRNRRLCEGTTQSGDLALRVMVCLPVRGKK